MPFLKPIFHYLNITLFPGDVIDFFSDVTEKAVALREGNQTEKEKVTHILILTKGGSLRIHFYRSDLKVVCLFCRPKI